MSNLNSLYARLGGEEGVIRLVKAYIEALKTLPGAQRLRSLYPEDLSKYELRMTEFLSTWLGGPALYQERHGMPMLRESHRSFAIDGEARDEWMLCMRMALRETVSDSPPIKCNTSCTVARLLGPAIVHLTAAVALANFNA